MAAVIICSDFEAQENKVCHCFIVSPSICNEVIGLDTMIFIFWVLSLKPAFSPFSFPFIKRILSSSLLYAKRVVSSTYQVIDISLAVLIPFCVSSSLAFCMMYSAYKLNKHSDNIQPWCTPFPIWNQSVSQVQFLLLLLDMHTDFSGGRSGGLVFPSLEEFSTVYCDPRSQRLWHSQ